MDCLYSVGAASTESLIEAVSFASGIAHMYKDGYNAHKTKQKEHLI